MIVPHEMENAVDQKRVESCRQRAMTLARLPGRGIDRNHDIPKWRVRELGHRRQSTILVEGERQDIGRTVPAPIPTIQGLHLAVIDNRKTQLSTAEPERA